MSEDIKTINRATMHRLLKQEPDHDWLQYLKPHEFARDDIGNEYPKVIGLRRLANIRGIKDMHIQHLDTVEIRTKNHGNVPFVSVAVRIEFADGVVSADVADCYQANCSKYGNFPASTAVSRAIGRAIARSFNIERVLEEIDPVSTADSAFLDTNAKAGSNELTIIKTMCKSRKLKIDDQLRALFGSETKPLEELTSGDASRLIKFINDGKV